jgi:uncharacterized membrane protein (UPF0127 family)
VNNGKQHGYAFNRTRQAFLSNELEIANSHWTRLKGLIGTPASRFYDGKGLWIVPSHGVHTIAMRYAIDVVYLNEQRRVVMLQESVVPWRVTPICLEAETVLELPQHTVFRTHTAVGDEIEIEFMEEASEIRASEAEVAK